MTKLNELTGLERAHWELHLNACLKDTPALSKEITTLLKGGVLPNLKHPSSIHDWMEHPEMRAKLEDYHG